MLDDPLPGHKKTQLVLKIISGQQLPKPRDSVFGDRGEVKQKIYEAIQLMVTSFSGTC